MRNLGNTCFAAAAVTALRACPRLRRALASRTTELSGLLVAVMEDPGSEAWPVLVARMDKLIGRRAGEPHDSHELICAIVNKLGLEPWFSINLTTGIKCTSCERADAIHETNIYVAAEPAASLAAGLTAAHAPRWIEGRECEGCQRRRRAAIRAVPRAPPPEVLMIRAPPPEVGGGGGTWIEHAFGYCGARYRVRAVILYRGDGRGGHYTCAVWYQTKSKWVVHDDDAIAGGTMTSVAGASLIRNANTVLYDRA